MTLEGDETRSSMSSSLPATWAWPQTKVRVRTRLMSGRLHFGGDSAIMAPCQVFRSRMCQNARTQCCASARPLLTSHCKSICAPG